MGRVKNLWFARQICAYLFALKNPNGKSRFNEPPYAEPHVRWCERTAGVTLPPTRLFVPCVNQVVTGDSACEFLGAIYGKGRLADALSRAIEIESDSHGARKPGRPRKQGKEEVINESGLVMGID